jgi:hypothetical protein
MVERYVPATPEVFQLLSSAVELLDAGRRVDGDDPVRSKHGYGGRAEGTRRWRFTFFPVDAKERWEFELDEDEVRLLGEDVGDLLDGTEIQVVAAPIEAKKGKKPSAADPLGKRLLDRLVKLEAIELAKKARVDAIAVAFERVVIAALDDESLDDDERGERIADAIAGTGGVEELYATDDQLLRLVRELDAQ